MTYAELTNEIIANLEIDSSDLGRYQVVEKINLAQLEIINVLPFNWIANIIKTSYFNLLAPANPNNHLYQWPPDFLRFVQGWVCYTVSPEGMDRDHQGLPLNEWIADNHHKTIDQIATINFPFIDIHHEGGFEIRPAPAAAVTNGGRLRYVWRIPAVDTGQPSLLNYNLKPLLVHRASELAAMVDNYRPDLANRFKKLFEEDLANFMPKREKR